MNRKDYWQEIYNNKEDHWFDRKVSLLAKRFAEQCSGFDVLEIGCADGVDSIYLASKGFNVIGIDLIDFAIRQAKNKHENLPDDVKQRLLFQVGNAENLSFKNESFDGVYSVSVLHSTNINLSIREIFRVLGKNGKCLVHLYVGNDKTVITYSQFLNAIKSAGFLIDDIYTHNNKGDYDAAVAYLTKPGDKNDK